MEIVCALFAGKEWLDVQPGDAPDSWVIRELDKEVEYRVAIIRVRDEL